MMPQSATSGNVVKQGTPRPGSVGIPRPTSVGHHHRSPLKQLTKRSSSATPRTASTAKENGRWMKKSGGVPTFPGGLVCRDFLPKSDPDRSSCCTTEYATFSETVQAANEWLVGQGGSTVVACESQIYDPGDTNPTLTHTWPVTTHLRGVRVWVKGGGAESPGGNGSPSGRALLTYRDFTPHLDGKTKFNRDYEDVTVLLERLNTYLADRSYPAHLLGLHTLDTPVDGLLDVETDTERSRLSYPQHGYTRYCRSLRLFFVTQRHHRADAYQEEESLTQLRLGIKDFVPKAKTENSSRVEVLSEVIKRANNWCATTPGIKLLNIQVLPLRAGTEDTQASTWVLESPGHIPNKFTSFVRVAYIISQDDEENSGASPDCGLLKNDGAFHREGNHDSSSVSCSSTQDDVEAFDPLGINGDVNKLPRPQRLILPAVHRTSHGKEGEKFGDIPSSMETNGGSKDSEVASLPGVVSVRKRSEAFLDLAELIHCKTFIPRLTSSGSVCGREEWEDMDHFLTRINSWIAASKAKLITIHTQYVHYSGSEVRMEETGWVQHLAGRQQVGVVHVVVAGGRPPTSIADPSMETSARCAIL